ncbi:tyrosine-type recombinase/integrase [Paraburkholderia sp. MM5477-R1]|uniref:tyrosine-type recombinase/integrase n=1 Tax=Paraburkholderia sp. MM5477-R1 TaxID=2991062 RepID=UPI003D1AA653
MVQIIRKATLPNASEVVVERLHEAATLAPSIVLKEPRPAGFPLLFTRELDLIEPAVAFLHEHFVQRAHTADTLRTYAEILYDWFETLEQNHIAWKEASPSDLVAYRNRMLLQPSGHTGRPYRITTVNHRVRGVLRFYQWAVRKRWLLTSDLAGPSVDYTTSACARSSRRRPQPSSADDIFVLRQFEALPRPLSSAEVRELLSTLSPPYDLMAKWQIYTGLRVSELLRLELNQLPATAAPGVSRHVVDVIRKGRKLGYVIVPSSLIDETAGYRAHHRTSWINRAKRLGRARAHSELFVNQRGTAACKNTYQKIIAQAGRDCGFKASTHQLRATFACMLLARLEQIARDGAAIDPLLVVKVLMGHERISTTDRYLRAISVDGCEISAVLETLLCEEGTP